MAIFSTLVKWAGGGFPDLQPAPEYPLVDPALQQRRALDANLAAVPLETTLAGRTNRANLAQTEALFGQAMPGFSQMRELTENALLSYLRGEIPSDVAGAVSRQANIGALSRFGPAGGSSGIGQNLRARDLGRTSEDLLRFGLGASQAYQRGNPLLAATPRYAVGQSFLDPEWMANFERAQQDSLFSRNVLAAKLKERVDPFTAAWTSDVGQLADLAGSAALGYVGGAAGLGGAMGGAAGSGGFSMGGLGTSMLGGILGGGGGSQAPAYDPWAFNFGYSQGAPSAPRYGAFG